MEIGIQQGYNGEFINVRVERRVADMDGKPFGVTNENIFKYYQRYEVQHVDGMTEKMPTKIIDENVLSQVYKEGKMKIILHAIIDHRVGPDDVPMKGRHYKIRN